MMYIEQAPLGGNFANFLKNKASLSNGTETKATDAVNDFRIPNGNCKTEFPSRAIGKHKFNEIADSKQAQQSLAIEEEEEDEQYELIDIIEESDNPDSQPIDQERLNSIPNGYEIEINLGETLKETSTLTDRKAVVDNSNSDSEEYEYRLVRIPKRQVKNEQKAGFTIVEPKQKCTPVPAAIPIERYLHNRRQRLPNGISARQLAADVHESTHHSIAGNSAYSYFESGLEQRTFNDILTREKQMGIDILGGIRHFFNWRPKIRDTETTEAQLGKRKRRTENLSTAGLFKYRKVENNFPKIITHTLDDDYTAAYRTPIFNTQQNLTDLPNLVHPNQGSFDMKQRGTEQKARRSWFKAPQTTNKIVRNTYADIEFSDDDDDEDNSRFQQSLGINVASANSTSRMQPKVINIPIRVEQPSVSMTSLRPTLPSSSTLTRGYVTPSTLFNIGSMPKPTYAESLRYNPPFGCGIGHTLNGRSYSSNASSGSGASTSRFGKDFGNMARLNSKALGRSIIIQDREIEEHAKYKQLLETINRAQNCSSNSFLPRNLSKKPRVLSKFPLATCTPRAPLSSTINIDDDGEYDDVTITGISHIKTPKKSKKHETTSISTVVLDDVDDEDDISEIIDLDKDQPKKRTIATIDLDAKENKHDDLPYVEPVNSFREKLNTIPHLRADWLQMHSLRWEEKRKLREAVIHKTIEDADKLTAERRVAESELQERLRDFRIVDPELIVVDDFAEPEVEEEPELPELTTERQQRIQAAIYGPPDQILVQKFNMNITRRHIQTLLGHNWLNDEVINFYMNLLTERSELKYKSHGYPMVYAMNTFFLSRLSQAGYSGVKRWTRKINIFEKDIIPIPVHVGGVHWCMAIIHLKNRWIRYYDSMGSPNPTVLKLLEQYLKDESLDKRKQPFDTSDFVIESVRDVPRQMNGSDCGVFSCMFAEYVTRNKEITFSQQHMEYFRHKMILEIVQGELLL